MSILQQLLTPQLTTAAMDKARSQGSQTTGEQKTRPVPFFKWFFLIFLIVGVAASILLVLFPSCPASVAMVILGVTLFFCIPGLMLSLNCWVQWDDSGFLISSFWGRKQFFSYTDIATLENIQVEDQVNTKIRTKNGRRLELNDTWTNRSEFLHAIYDHRKDLFQ